MKQKKWKNFGQKLVNIITCVLFKIKSTLPKRRDMKTIMSATFNEREQVVWRSEVEDESKKD